jgi:enoyl-CoA hydratase/carnithine racemase
MPEYKLISADSHVSEPPDLWSSRVDKKYRERAPQLMVNPPGKEGAYFHYEGFAPHPIGIGLGAGKSPDAMRAAKRLLNLAVAADAKAGLLAESVEQQKLIGGPNQLEAILSNLQKRAANYRD